MYVPRLYMFVRPSVQYCSTGVQWILHVCMWTKTEAAQGKADLCATKKAETSWGVGLKMGSSAMCGAWLLQHCYLAQNGTTCAASPESGAAQRTRMCGNGMATPLRPLH